MGEGKGVGSCDLGSRRGSICGGCSVLGCSVLVAWRDGFQFSAR